MKPVMSSHVPCAFLALSASMIGLLAASAGASVLTFRIEGLVNFSAMPLDYGDRIIAFDDGSFHYDIGDEGFTPNIIVDYPSLNSVRPAYWSTGYGDLVDVYFDDTESSGQGEIVLTADYGYEVVLYSFEMAAYSSAFGADPTINAVRVMDCSSSALFEATGLSISRSIHTGFDFNAQPLHARQITIRFDSSNLGNLSDDIGLDNIRFGQAQVPLSQIPCLADFAPPACQLNFFDVSAFLAAYTAASMSADLNGDGQFNFFDVSAFLSAYTAGCGN